MQKMQKKGFTIVELVVVIAVIAILAAVLIPTFVNLINKAEFNNDQALVRNLNTTLAISAEGKDGKPTMYETLKEVHENGGFNVEVLTPRSNGSDIVWDQEHNQFVLVYDNGTKFFTGTQWDKNLNKTKMWKIVSEVPENSEYSLYLKNGYSGTTVNANGFGVDVGENTGIETVNYTNTAGNSKTVIIRTNSAETTLVVDDKSTGTINHYGSAGELNIIECHTDSYHEKGKVAFAEITEGHIVLENGSDIEHIHINSNGNNAFNQIKITDNGAKELPSKITRDAVTVTAKTLVVVVESKGAAAENVYVDAANGTDTTGTTQKTETRNENVNSLLGQLVLDNGAGENALDADAKEEVKTEVVDQLAAEEIANANTNGATYVARIGAKGYETFKAAVEAAHAGETIVVISDFDISSNIGNSDLVKAINNKVVINADTTIIFKNNAKVYMTNNGMFELNGNYLNVMFDSSCEGSQTSGFMNCSMLYDYHGVNTEYWGYTFENNCATVYTDFYGVDDFSISPLVYTKLLRIGVGFAGQDDNLWYDQAYAGYVQSYNNKFTYGSGITIGYDSVEQDFYTARIYLKPGAKSYVWETFSDITYNWTTGYYTYGTETDEDVVKVLETHDNGAWIVLKGVSGDYGTIGKGAIVKVTITNQDDTITTYEWHITVTLGMGGMSGGFGGDDPFEFGNW